MTQDKDPLEEIARALARIETVVNSNSRKLGEVQTTVGELNLRTSEIKREAGRLLLRFDDLEETLEREQKFTSGLYDNHEKRIAALEDGT